MILIIHPSITKSNLDPDVAFVGTTENFDVKFVFGTSMFASDFDISLIFTHGQTFFICYSIICQLHSPEW